MIWRRLLEANFSISIEHPVVVVVVNLIHNYKDEFSIQ